MNKMDSDSGSALEKESGFLICTGKKWIRILDLHWEKNPDSGFALKKMGPESGSALGKMVPNPGYEEFTEFS